MKTPLILLTATFAMALTTSGLRAEDPHPAASLLFAQTAQGVEYNTDGQTLRLKNVSPVVTFFTDRPQRIAGHLSVPGFIMIWGEGKDSFAADPPNAALTVQDGKRTISCVVELTDPRIEGNDLVYTVGALLEGTIPDNGGATSVFIDSLLGPIVSGTTGQAALRTGAVGALVGSMDGNAGEGALIGAGVGILGNTIQRNSGGN